MIESFDWIELELDKTRRAWLGWGGIADIEDETGESFSELETRMSSGTARIKDILLVIWGGLRTHDRTISFDDFKYTIANRTEPAALQAAAVAVYKTLFREKAPDGSAEKNAVQSPSTGSS